MDEEIRNIIIRKQRKLSNMMNNLLRTKVKYEMLLNVSLVLVTVSLLLIALLANKTVTKNIFYEHITMQETKQVVAVDEVLSVVAGSVADKTKLVSMSLSNVSFLDTKSVSNYLEYADNVVDNGLGVHEMFVVNNAGRLITSSDERLNIDISVFGEGVQKALRGVADLRKVILPVAALPLKYRGEFDSVMVLMSAVPIKENGTQKGVVVGYLIVNNNVDAVIAIKNLTSSYFTVFAPSGELMGSIFKETIRLTPEQIKIANEYIRLLKEGKEGELPKGIIFDEQMNVQLTPFDKEEPSSFNLKFVAEHDSDYNLVAIRVIAFDVSSYERGFFRVDRLFWLSLLVAIIVSALTGSLLAKLFKKPIARISEGLSPVSAGNLTARVKSDVGGIIENLKTSTNNVISALQDLVRSIRNSSCNLDNKKQEVETCFTKVNIGVNEVSTAITNVVEDAEKQAGYVMTLKETTDSITIVKEKLSDAFSVLAEKIEEAVQRTNEGNLQVKETKQINNSLQDSIKSLAEENKHLINISKEVSGMVEIIRDVTSKTNLLSLNASIEAARAGEYGKGFAVVANEIKVLASTSKAQTVEIDKMIAKMEERISIISKKTCIATNNIEAADRSVKKTEDSFNNIYTNIGNVKTHVVDVGEAVELLGMNTLKLEEEMSNISTVTENNLAVTEEVTATTTEQVGAMEVLNGLLEDVYKEIDSLAVKVARFTI